MKSEPGNEDYARGYELAVVTMTHWEPSDGDADDGTVWEILGALARDGGWDANEWDRGYIAGTIGAGC